MQHVGVLSLRLFPTLWTVAHQAPLFMEFSRNGLPFPPPGDLPHPGIQPKSPAASALHADSLLLSYLGSPKQSQTSLYEGGIWKFRYRIKSRGHCDCRNRNQCDATPRKHSSCRKSGRQALDFPLDPLVGVLALPTP